MEIRRGASSRRDWHSLPVPVWDRGGCKDLSVTVAAQVFANAAVQLRGQARRASPPCCNRFDDLISKGTGTRCQSPMLQSFRRLNQQGDWHSLPVPVWDRGGCNDLSVTVAAQVFANAAVQPRGQARRASPPTSKAAGRMHT